jgi:hypothetical protein
MNDKAPMAPSDSSDTEVTQGRRPYVAPELIVFGNVEEFTRGTGTSPTLDGNRRTRKK